jgi:hypothetical protein
MQLYSPRSCCGAISQQTHKPGLNIEQPKIINRR